jgi:hypothetical protein
MAATPGSIPTTLPMAKSFNRISDTPAIRLITEKGATGNDAKGDDRRQAGIREFLAESIEQAAGESAHGFASQQASRTRRR